ncbi:transporter substrate-binding domain-containing protein [Meiothermus granaticius]|uniref:L-cystine-binding protein FliY n=1 Tax=Meiothermus granaticius NBRC 107808 TaxID=1227551 RepID=A0A399FA82_9DEIN|nr:transporter substrate-binding domain-containing protein [Meiothermus granaticius]MCL6526399.1 transporter substrate-binding domain-containing protein [Thermaceae bacterium]RIH93504.1 L-cystine-binding protein FliY [Meiothermus granaticius NBRC 107808]GEM85999.1 ABC transporter substrate-binding protein [Meiothermus granaticius NBRC 107808]
MKNIGKAIWVGAVTAMLLVTGALVQGTRAQGQDLLARVKAAGVLRVANTQASPPWSMIDDNKQLVGFDVDVANELARRLGIAKVEFVAGRFADFVAGIEAGKYDIVIAGQTITEERKKAVDFSNPYQAISVSVFTRPSRTGQFKSINDLNGKRVAVTAGSTQEKFVREQIPGATPKTYENGTLALLDVAFGRADAGLFNRFVGSYLAQRNGLLVAPAFDLGVELNAMSFRKGETAFKAAVDKALAEMIADGSFSAISKKWLGGQDMVAALVKYVK